MPVDGEQGFIADEDWEKLDKRSKRRRKPESQEDEKRVCKALAAMAETCRWWRGQMRPLLQKRRQKFRQTVLRTNMRLSKLAATHDKVLQRGAAARAALTSARADNANLRAANAALQAQAEKDEEELRLAQRAIRVSNRDKAQRVSGHQKDQAVMTESSAAGLFEARGHMRPRHRDNICKQVISFL